MQAGVSDEAKARWQTGRTQIMKGLENEYKCHMLSIDGKGVRRMQREGWNIKAVDLETATGTFMN